MTDVFTREKRSWLMSRIRGVDTSPEKLVRSFLHRRGFRFRLHDSQLPGKPDIVLPRYRTIVLVNGCFWHGHRACRKGRQRPESNPEFWERKITANIGRDRAARKLLRKMGWTVLTLWECQVRRPGALERLLKPLLRYRGAT